MFKDLVIYILWINQKKNRKHFNWKIFSEDLFLHLLLRNQSQWHNRIGRICCSYITQHDHNNNDHNKVCTNHYYDKKKKAPSAIWVLRNRWRKADENIQFLDRQSTSKFKITSINKNKSIILLPPKCCRQIRLSCWKVWW